MRLTVDGKDIEIDADPQMPLLWALRDIAGILGPKFGCGIAACGACTVVIDGAPVRSCSLPVGDVHGAVTTIEGPAEWYPAEDYHQEYWEGEGQRNPYCLASIPPKLMKLRKSFANRVKA